MKKILFFLFISIFLIGCKIEHPTFSGMFVSQAGDRIYFKYMHPESGFVNDVSFVSEGRTLTFSLNDVKELYLIRDGVGESTKEKDIITEKPKEFRDINAYK